MVHKLKTIGAYLLTLLLTVLTLGGYAYRQKQKAEQAEKENERLTIENQGNIEHINRTQSALAENSKRQAKTEQDLQDGKRDYFEHSDW